MKYSSPYNKSLTATVYIINDGKVLLHKHKKYNTWFPVGGHLEENELPHQAAIREAKEESGLNIRLIDTDAKAFPLGLVERVPTPFAVYHEGIGHEEEFLDFIYIAVSDKNTAKSTEMNTDSFRWFSISELSDENEVIKLHIRNTALSCISYVNALNNRPSEVKYFSEGIL